LDIPKKFMIGGKTFQVKLNNELDYEKGNEGSIDYRKCEVELQSSKGIMTEDAMKHTFWHEVVHGILDSMGEHIQSNDEKYVDTFALLLHQVIESSNGKITIKGRK